jgi:hypothetical protein
MGGEREVYRGFVGNPEEKSPHGRPTYKWEDVMKIDFTTTWVGVACVHPAQVKDRWGALANAVMNLRVVVRQS